MWTSISPRFQETVGVPLKAETNRKGLNMASKQSEAVKRYWENSATNMATNPPLDELRDFVEDWATLTAEPGNVDYLETEAGGVRAMWAVPKGCVEDRVLLSLHGGGFIGGSMYTHRKLFGHLAKKVGCRALILDYRLTPEHPHPSQIDDALAAYRWLLDQDITGNHIALVGDSAGGGLGIGLLLKVRDLGLSMAAAAMPISAWTDMVLSGDSYQSNREKDVLFRKEMVEMLVGMYLGSGDRRDPYASPLYGVLEGLPPIYMQVGGDEALLDDSRLFADRAEEAGVDVRLDIFPEMLHTFQMAAGRAPEADDAISRLAEWVRPKLGL
jgi:monoterpene epsilon-lactone hydrolase